MTKQQVRDAYHALRLGYDAAIIKLINLGLNEAQADSFLFRK